MVTRGTTFSLPPCAAIKLQHPFHSLHIYSVIVPHDALLEDDTSIADRRRALWMLVRVFFSGGFVQEEPCAGFKLDLVPVWLYQ